MSLKNIKTALAFMSIGTFFMVFFYLCSINDDSVDQNIIDKIALSLEGEEFIANTRKKAEIISSQGNICLDSEGVYRQCDDDEYEEQVISARIDKNPPLSFEWNVGGGENDETEDALKEVETAIKPWMEDSNSKNRKQHSKLKLNQLRNYDGEENPEVAASQFSGVKGSVRNISNKVKNADKRFVSDQRILFSEVYEQVDLPEDLELLVIVTSAASKRARRDSIRGTWWTECPQNSQVKCFFFTDDINSKKLKDVKRELLREKSKYNDIVFQPIDIGLQFGLRMLYQMQWAAAHYRFKYLLRVDDDTMVCLHHLLHDLKSMRTTNLHWGYLHCEIDRLIYIDEGLVMFSRDLVLRFLTQDPFKMRCHVFGDQQVALWINDLNLNQKDIYVHDSRIHHHPAASDMQQYFLELDDICAKHIIVHGVYPGTMDDFWEKKRSRTYSKYKPEPITNTCEKQISFFWYDFDFRFHYRPRYCYERPTWDASHMQADDGTFYGREIGLE